MFQFIKPLSLLMLSQAMLLVGHGLVMTLLPLRAKLEGFTLAEIGLTGAAYFVGFTVGCILTPLIARRAGHIRTFAILASTMSVFALLLPMWPEFVPWLVLRFAIGWAIAGLYMLIESWLNESATNENRGTLMSVYMFINLSMIMLGQMMLNFGDLQSSFLFSIASILLSMSLVPVALATDAPAPIQSVKIDLRLLWRTSHVAFFGTLLAGAAAGGFWSLAPVYAESSGLNTLQITLFSSAAVAGGALSQIPIGRLSDRYDRRVVVMVSSACAAVMASLLAIFDQLAFIPAVIMAFLFGAACMPLYALCVAHANDRTQQLDFVVIGSGLLMLNGLGSAIGALLAGLMMTTPLGNGGMFAFAAAMYVALIASIAVRRRTRVVPLHETNDEPFVAVSDHTPIALVLDPRMSESSTTDSDVQNAKGVVK